MMRSKRVKSVCELAQATLSSAMCGLICLCFSSTVYGQHGFGDRTVLRAQEALANGRDAEALEHLQLSFSLIRDGSSLESQALLLSSWAAAHIGNYEQAIELSSELESRLTEIRDYVWHIRAGAQRGLGRWRDAMSEWRKITSESPDSPLVASALFSLGDAHYALRDLKPAAEHYDYAIKKFPRHDRSATARFNRARIAEAQRDFATAKALYRRIAFRSPLDFFADASLRRLKALVDLNHVSGPSLGDYLGRVDRLLNARALKDARAEIERLQALKLGRTDQRALDERYARLMYREDRFSDACGLFQRLADSSHGARRVRFLQWVSRSLAAQKRFAEAVDIYEALARQYGSSSEGRTWLYKAAWLSYNGGDYTRSLTLFREFVARHRNNYEVDDAQWFLAWNAYRLGDHSSALQELRTLRRSYPRSKLLDRTYYWEARILQQDRRFEEAARVYRTAIQRSPDGYYAVYSRQRLNELAAEVAPEQDPIRTLAELGRVRLASIDREPTAYPETEDESSTRESETTPIRRMPIGTATLDWTTPAGRRALTLMRLGFLDEATELIRQLPPLEGFSADDVNFSRAQLLHTLGDYYAAYRIATSRLRDPGERGYTPSARPVYEMLYPLAHPKLTSTTASEWNIPEYLLLSVIRQESAYNDRARSWVSARGLMQIIPPTAERIAEALEFEDFHPGLLNDPVTNIRFGGWYLRALIDSYQGHALLALGAYNAGPIAINRWLETRSELQTDEFIEEIPYSETRGYVKRIVANIALYHRLYGGTFRIPNRVTQPSTDGITF